MKQTLALAARVAASPHTTILLCGETGVGKGVLARAIHQAARGLSARSWR
ncbi:MAG: sigma-54 factor interaction domain-containing protein [Armatimonadetes bacterium]|nr:sigma-54 factor interaction domain-containing protein [Armatimonadota bacterium]NCP28562.1 sigma-54 factor interaction domain-containing protein [Armatimonadota bacterium]NDK14353.1 sigma-54 factor interaction domain-containing protein [Armatimonadota bacterium]